MLASEEDVILLLGYAVFEAQEAEAALHLTLSVVCGLSEAESISHLKKIYEKKTMGQFLRLVRERIGINESFDDFMREYIEQRNFIVHNLSRCSTFSLYTDDGRLKLNHFLTGFRHKNRKVRLTFMALTEAWLGNISSEYKATDKLKEFRDTDLFREIKEEFIPQLRLIFEKNSRGQV